MSERTDVEALLERLDAVEARLGRHAGSPASPGLTDPDDPSGERWEWGQVWAHVAEFVPYWAEQMRRVVSAPGNEPVPFGRVKTDSGRIAAIEANRGTPHTELMERVERALGELKAFLARLSAEDWRKQGAHETLGAMGMPQILERFEVRHLEEHAAQLDLLRQRAGRPE